MDIERERHMQKTVHIQDMGAGFLLRKWNFQNVEKLSKLKQ